jgi:hypothetical protein
MMLYLRVQIQLPLPQGGSKWHKEITVEQMVNDSSTGLEALTYYLKFDGSNPASAGAGREKIASKYLFNSWPAAAAPPQRLLNH